MFKSITDQYSQLIIPIQGLHVPSTFSCNCYHATWPLPNHNCGQQWHLKIENIESETVHGYRWPLLKQLVIFAKMQQLRKIFSIANANSYQFTQFNSMSSLLNEKSKFESLVDQLTDYESSFKWNKVTPKETSKKHVWLVCKHYFWCVCFSKLEMLQDDFCIFHFTWTKQIVKIEDHFQLWFCQFSCVHCFQNFACHDALANHHALQNVDSKAGTWKCHGQWATIVFVNKNVNPSNLTMTIKHFHLMKTHCKHSEKQWKCYKSCIFVYHKHGNHF